MWEELKKLQDKIESDTATVHDRFRQKVLLGLTETIDEHPENYDGPCFCRLCMSYGQSDTIFSN